MINSMEITPFQMVESKFYLSRNEKCHQLQQRNASSFVAANYTKVFGITTMNMNMNTHTLTAVNSLKRKRIVKNSIRLSNELTGRWDLWFRFANANTKKHLILLFSLTLSLPFDAYVKLPNEAHHRICSELLTTHKNGWNLIKNCPIHTVKN